MHYQIVSNSEDFVKAHHLDSLPFQEIRNVMMMVKELVTQDSQYPRCLVNLIAGVWVPKDPNAVALSWSPLEQIRGDVQEDLKDQTCRFVFRELGRAIQSLHEASKELWKKKWPQLCQKFVIRGKSLLSRIWIYNNVLQIGALQRITPQERT